MNISEYIDDKGRSPFSDWINNLDRLNKARIRARLLRIEGTDNLGDLKNPLAEARRFFYSKE